MTGQKTGLKVDNLQGSFRDRQVVKGISFEIPTRVRGGLIGESGSGKSVTALALMGLLGEDAKITGSISLAGKELLSLTDREMSQLRGSEIGMVFQEPDSHGSSRSKKYDTDLLPQTPFLRK